MEAALATILFMIVILAIVLRIVEEAVAALIGVFLMIILTSYTPEQAFNYIDWDVMAILFGMWIITGYMIKAGFSYVVLNNIKKRVSSYRALLMLLAVAAGFISMFVDNVLVILLFGSLVLEAARRSNANPVLAVLLIGFSANFMGTALLMGDLPPQLLHSVAGAEFLDFIWSHGRPSSFILLTITFIITLGSYYWIFVRKEPDKLPQISDDENNVNKGLLLVSSTFFVLTVIGMALRPMLGVPLGFITMMGASSLALTVELARKAGKDWPGFDDILLEVEWRALLFYASLFSLVGGLEHSGALYRAAESLIPYLNIGGITAYSLAYWVVGGLSSIVEHDALLLTFLYIIKNAAAAGGFNPWPLYWGMAWSATLASNTTTAAAPALYVALTLAEEKGYRVSPKEFLKYSIPFAWISLVVHFIISAIVWAPLIE
ncbi:MAG: permease [Desulfurococcales archaeon]|nr:permease [Desulfurococcales archaeon]